MNRASFQKEKGTVDLIPPSDHDGPPGLHAAEARHHRSYSKEAVVYDQKRFETFGEQLIMGMLDSALREWLRPSKGRRILDVAAGTCRASIELARHGATVVGVDLTEEMLRQGQTKIAEAGITTIRLHRANGRQLPFKDNSFDHAISLRFMHLIPLEFQRLFLNEMMRVLKPGGYMIVEFNNPFYGGLFGFYHSWLNWKQRRQKPPGRLWPHQVPALFAGFRMVGRVGIRLPGMGRIARWSRKWALRYGRMAHHFPLNLVAGTTLFICQKDPG